MNERIKELADQCSSYNNDGWMFDKEKFARLLIKECMEIAHTISKQVVVDDRTPYNSGYRNGRMIGAGMVRTKIANKFGIKDE